MTKGRQKRCPGLLWLKGLSLAAFLLTMAQPVRAASTFQSAMIQYTKGNFRAAASGLQSALRQRQSQPERGRTYKFLGISQFMLGDKSAAASSFRAALKTDPNIQIQPSEVLDESVIQLFNQQRGAGATPSASVAAGSSRAKHTSLQVLTNVPGATILLGGIIAGRSGETFEADPGSAVVEISAPGYTTQKRRTTIIANRQNTIRINLTRQASRPRVVAATPRRAAKSVPKRATQSAPQKVDDIFLPDVNEAPTRAKPAPSGRNLADEFSRDAATGGATAQPQVPVYAPAPAPAPAPAAVPYAQPVYQAPQPTYAQPPVVYQQPGYGPYPQQVYAPPPPAAPPSYNNGYLPPPNYGNTSPNPNKIRARVAKRRPTNVAVALLPLGAGQFYNRDYMLGSLFAVAQVGCFVGGFLRYQEMQKYLAEANATITEAENDPSYSQEDLDAYRSQSASYVQKLQTESYIWFAGAGVLWAVSSVQAIIVGRDNTVADIPRESEAIAQDPKLNLGLGWKTTVDKDVVPALAMSLQWKW